MAYSQFLQHKAFKFQINIGPGYREGELLVCCCVLKALDNWLTQDEHERVLPSADLLKKELFDICNEVNIMYEQGRLTEFWEVKYIKSVSDLRTALQQAYSHAYTASEEYDDGRYLPASENIHRCHDNIKRALTNILISHY
ncbi:hypothetical protein EPA93_46280 [Ktedonosporobacter rubrisoli]|uniref:Uncharacterized protein n=1 Tax=Ktedonosporobacter rubrisoli TaxID=2509675 RepID=A0A4V0Z0E9_KTERU|nr:hypothetical protein [Ktedonosporobacter rubrisoli]QBD82981.1 hypothetical protein EPA93_46280 [Ktedonosporobacter rubrisoli]